MLNLESLEVRRIFLDLVFIHKTVFGNVRIDASDMFKFNQGSTRGHRFKINVQYSRFNISRFFFL